MNLGQLLQSEGKYDEALKLTKEALQDAQNDYNTYKTAADNYARLKANFARNQASEDTRIQLPRLKGKVDVVTGSGSGIGKAMAKAGQVTRRGGMVQRRRRDLRDRPTRLLAQPNGLGLELGRVPLDSGSMLLR